MLDRVFERNNLNVFFLIFLQINQIIYMVIPIFFFFVLMEWKPANIFRHDLYSWTFKSFNACAVFLFFIYLKFKNKLTDSTLEINQLFHLKDLLSWKMEIICMYWIYESHFLVVFDDFFHRQSIFRAWVDKNGVLFWNY